MIFLGVLGVPAPTLSFTYVERSDSITDVLALPTGAQAGDWCVYAEFAFSFGGVPSAVNPSGWDQRVNETDSANMRASVYSKVLDAGDISAGSITGMNGDAQDLKLMMCFRPSEAIASETASTWTKQLAAGNPSSQVIAASGSALPLIAVAFASTSVGAAPDPFSWTPSYDALVTPAGAGSGNYMLGAYKIVSSSPADITIDMDDEGSGNFLAGGYSRFT